MRRLKKILKWTGIVLAGLVAIGLVANAVYVWTTDTRLEGQLTAIRAAGDPLTLADLARPPIPPEKNAATYLRRAEADLTAIEKQTVNAMGAAQAPGFLLSDENQKAIRTALAAYPEAIPLLQQAAACPDYDGGLDYTLPPQEFLAKLLDVVTKARSAARVLYARSALLVAEGNRDEAVRTALLIFRLAHHFDRNPLLVDYLVAIAIRGVAVQSVNEALQTGPVSREVRDVLHAELAAQERMEGFLWALKSERAYSLTSFREEIPLRNFWLVARGMWNTQESACLDLHSTFLMMAGEQGPYQDIQPTSEVRKAILAALLFPAMKGAYKSVTRTRARVRCLRVLNALQTHAPAESGEVPKLSELGLPAEAITDPFSGKPLCVKKTPQGWLVYSVGDNLKDDGGKLDDPEHSDVGIGPPTPAAKAGQKTDR